MTIAERIKDLRKNKLNLTQDEFSKTINISRSNLGSIETERVRPTERVLSDISTRLGIDYDWLLTGEGDWEINIDREDEIIGFAQKIAMPGEESFKKDFLHTLSQLDERDWETLEKIALLMQKEKS